MGNGLVTTDDTLQVNVRVQYADDAEYSTWLGLNVTSISSSKANDVGVHVCEIARSRHMKSSDDSVSGEWRPHEQTGHTGSVADSLNASHA